MRLIRAHGAFAVLALAALGLGVWLWGFGGAAQIGAWASAEQREVQNALAGALRAVRAGDGWALASLLGLCFAYGFFHAAGPGHGKLVMGGYALGTDALRTRLIWMTLAGALGQAVTAIVLVYAGVFVLGWSRSQMTTLADGNLEAMSAGAIVLVGLWLLARGVRKLLRVGRQAAHAHSHDHHHHHDHHHDHDHSIGADGSCETCGHAHGPSLEQVASVQGWRDAVAVVLAVAIRPCTGALFVLILTYGMGIALVGIVGALVMGLGTAVLTLAVALGAGSLRGGLVDRLDGPAGLRVMAGIEIVAGALVALVAGQIVLRLL